VHPFAVIPHAVHTCPPPLQSPGTVHSAALEEEEEGTDDGADDALEDPGLQQPESACPVASRQYCIVCVTPLLQSNDPLTSAHCISVLQEVPAGQPGKLHAIAAVMPTPRKDTRLP
jgi:hypothetical protein